MKNLDQLGRSLSPQEQRSVTGGVAAPYICLAAAKEGYHVESPGFCEGNFLGCNLACSTWCAASAGCAACACISPFDFLL